MSMDRRSPVAAVIFGLAISLLFSGCLLMESRELRLRIDPDGFGSGTMTYANLVSADEDGEDVSAEDLETLLEYFAGPEGFENEYQGASVTDLRLFERDGQLWGEIAFTFDSLGTFNLVSNGTCDTCSIFYRRSENPPGELAEPEAVVETNGEIVDSTDAVALVRWPADTEEIYLKTGLGDVDLSEARSLLPLWKSRLK